MKVFVRVKAGSSVRKVTVQDATHYLIEVKELPVRNKANLAVIEALAEHLKVPKSTVSIVRGQKTKTKTVEIQTNISLL
jgi:uncharacterized protein YggU (UPF0235/DUF167 family)